MIIILTSIKCFVPLKVGLLLPQHNLLRWILNPLLSWVKNTFNQFCLITQCFHTGLTETKYYLNGLYKTFLTLVNNTFNSKLNNFALLNIVFIQALRKQSLTSMCYIKLFLHWLIIFLMQLNNFALLHSVFIQAIQ